MPTQLDRRAFLTGFAATTTLACTLPSLAAIAPKAPAAKPNIVYILADDLGWGDLDTYNPQSLIPTPNLNAFAAQGMRFTDMHAASAVCTPSRYAVLTGRYPWRSRLKKGVLEGNSPNLIEPGRLTVPGMLQQLGYYTAGAGKWHLGLGTDEKLDPSKPLTPGPSDHGFDYFYGLPASLDLPPYFYFENAHAVEQPTLQDPGSKGQGGAKGAFWRPGPRAPHFDFPQVLPTFVQKSIDILHQRAAKPDQPFFLYVALPSPHAPWLPLPEYRGKSKAGEYGDYVVEVDAMVGRIFATLKQLKLDENTIVAFTSDNGAFWNKADIEKTGHRANADWRGQKADIWEAGHRIPFLIRWPGHIAPGTLCDQTASLTDLMATLADALHFPLPTDAAEDSFSNLPLWQGHTQKPVRSSTIEESNGGLFTIREGDWKLETGLGSGGFTAPVHEDPTPGGPQGQLYNLAADPAETTNLWLTQPDKVTHLSQLLKSQMQAGRTRP